MKAFRICRKTRKKGRGPSDEAIEARAEARRSTLLADVVYNERRRLLARNHFAERIRLTYEDR